MPNIVPLDMPAAYWRDKAQRARRAGSHLEAVRLYRAALRKHDDNDTRRELAETYADMRCLSVSDRLYLENLARDAMDTGSLYGLARNRSLAGDERTMADLLDLYLRITPCGQLADQARDILWRMPRDKKPPKRIRRAQVLCDQALDHMQETQAALKKARRSWQRGETVECAHVLSELYQRTGRLEKALEFSCKAVELAPEEMGLRLQLAQQLQLNGLHNACREALKAAREKCKQTDQAALYCRYAIGLECADLAVELMEERAKQYPNSTDTLLLLALALRAEGKDEDRAREMLRCVATIDEDDLVSRAMLDMDWQDGDDDAFSPLRLQEKIGEIFESRREEDADIHQELVQMMRLPMPGLLEMTVLAFMHRGDALGLRLALLEHDMPPVQCASILHALEQMGSPLPCFARVEGRLCLVPSKQRPPYDGDLHDLMRELIHRLHGRVSLDTLVKEVPPAWHCLPESARKHCAQHADDVWQTAFAAYLLLKSGQSEEAQAELTQSHRPMRAERAYMQLIRRSNTIHEVH